MIVRYQNGPEPNISDFATALCATLEERYGEAMSLLTGHSMSIAQCILSRRQIHLEDVVPGSNLTWESVTSSGLIWFERITNYGTHGYLIAPYIWLWMLARLPASENAKRLCQFLSDWQFNDYTELLRRVTGMGFSENTTFEVFCCQFRILRSLGFGNRQEVPLEFLHSGCKLRDDRRTIVVNRHLTFAEALHQYRTDSMAKKHKARTAEEVDSVHSGTLNAEAQLSHVILNGQSAGAGDFFLSIEIPTQRDPNRRRLPDEIVCEVGQCKLIREKKLTQNTYDAERNKSAGPDDIFILYTSTNVSDGFVLPDRSGLVDESCWDSYFGPFTGRAYIASWNHSSQD
jgi:hypothetical protein